MSLHVEFGFMMPVSGKVNGHGVITCNTDVFISVWAHTNNHFLIGVGFLLAAIPFINDGLPAYTKIYTNQNLPPKEKVVVSVCPFAHARKTRSLLSSWLKVRIDSTWNATWSSSLVFVRVKAHLFCFSNSTIKYKRHINAEHRHLLAQLHKIIHCTTYLRSWY